MADVAITITSNGCPDPRNASVADDDVVTFTNEYNGHVTITGLENKNTNGQGGKLSNKKELNLKRTGKDGSVKSITISSTASGTYEYAVDTCGLLGDPPKMIVG